MSFWTSVRDAVTFVPKFIGGRVVRVGGFIVDVASGQNVFGSAAKAAKGHFEDTMHFNNVINNSTKELVTRNQTARQYFSKASPYTLGISENYAKALENSKKIDDNKARFVDHRDYFTSQIKNSAIIGAGVITGGSGAGFAATSGATFAASRGVKAFEEGDPLAGGHELFNAYEKTNIPGAESPQVFKDFINSLPKPVKEGAKAVYGGVQDAAKERADRRRKKTGSPLNGNSTASSGPLSNPNGSQFDLPLLSSNLPLIAAGAATAAVILAIRRR